MTTDVHSKHSLGDEGLAEDEGVFAVDLEYADGRPADGGSANQNGPGVTEMVGPFVAAGVKQAGKLAGLRVEAGNVRAFESCCSTNRPGRGSR